MLSRCQSALRQPYRRAAACGAVVGKRYRSVGRVDESYPSGGDLGRVYDAHSDRVAYPAAADQIDRYAAIWRVGSAYGLSSDAGTALDSKTYAAAVTIIIAAAAAYTIPERRLIARFPAGIR